MDQERATFPTRKKCRHVLCDTAATAGFDFNHVTPILRKRLLKKLRFIFIFEKTISFFITVFFFSRKTFSCLENPSQRKEDVTNSCCFLMFSQHIWMSETNFRAGMETFCFSISTIFIKDVLLMGLSSMKSTAEAYSQLILMNKYNTSQ